VQQAYQCRTKLYLNFGYPEPARKKSFVALTEKGHMSQSAAIQQENLNLNHHLVLTGQEILQPHFF
jgi:hypothetical protein